MNKILIILSFIVLASCGASQEEKRNIAAVTCSIMGETNRNTDAAVRIREMNNAREKIGGEPFLRGDYAIQEAFEWGLCQELVLNENYDETLQPLKDAKQERERIAAEKLAEENRIAAENQRIADTKPSVKEEFHSNGKLQSRTMYQSKNDGGEKHGLYESYHENGQLVGKGNYKDGKQNGLAESYLKNGLLLFKVNYKDGKWDGLFEEYHENGKLRYKSCWKNGEKTDMSYCEK